MPLMEISIVPLGTKSTSLSNYIASAEHALQNQKGIKAQLTAMGTIVEAGSVNKLLCIAHKMHKAVIRAGARRVLTTIKIDERLDKHISIEGKVASVKKKLGKTKRT